MPVKRTNGMAGFKEKREARLKPGTDVSFYRHRDKEFRQYFQEDGVFALCVDIGRFLFELGIPSYYPDEWKLFIDSYKKPQMCPSSHC